MVAETSVRWSSSHYVRVGGEAFTDKAFVTNPLSRSGTASMSPLRFQSPSSSAAYDYRDSWGRTMLDFSVACSGRGTSCDASP
jgi:hypothetical protein